MKARSLSCLFVSFSLEQFFRLFLTIMTWARVNITDQLFCRIFLSLDLSNESLWHWDCMFLVKMSQSWRLFLLVILLGSPGVSIYPVTDDVHFELLIKLVSGTTKSLFFLGYNLLLSLINLSAQIVCDVTNGRSFKPASVSFWQVPIIFWAFSCFGHKLFQVFFFFLSLPSPL